MNKKEDKHRWAEGWRIVVYTNNVDIFQKYIFNINIYLYFLNYSQVVIIKKYLKKKNLINKIKFKKILRIE